MSRLNISRPDHPDELFPFTPEANAKAELRDYGERQSQAVG